MVARGKKRDRGGKRDTRTPSWNTIKRENKFFEEYYRSGHFLPAEEAEEMLRVLKTDLPNSFRFTGTKAEAYAVLQTLKTRYIPEFPKDADPPKVVDCFPDELVWDMTTDKKTIRRSFPFANFQKFLVSESTSGNISRQEVVSMIPPHFLDVKPGMVVLDMCAAPGSKSAQLAEMIHGDEEERVARAVCNESPNNGDGGDYGDYGRSTGLLIANDSDIRRTSMLTHQVKRLNFHNIIITNHDASIFPSIVLPSIDGKPQHLKFDRVLADVPCSGDGTARKNINVWSKWSPRDALGLHNLQVRILIRGLTLLKKNGRLVYSTCSMNPVENEAVVASAIKACGGSSKVQLVDCSDHLPKLKRKPGLKTWLVPDVATPDGNPREKTARVFTTWDKFLAVKEEYETQEPPVRFSSKICEGCFPPPEEDKIALERCMRIYPHLQNTGGFFIAVLEKLDNVKPQQPPGPADAVRSALQESPAVPHSPSARPSDRRMSGSEDHDAPSNDNAEDGILENGEPTDGADVLAGTSPLKRKRNDEGKDSVEAALAVDPPVNDALKKDDEQITSPKRAKTDGSALSDSIETDGAVDLSVNDVPENENGQNASGKQVETQTAPAPSKKSAKLKPEDQSQNLEYFEYLPANDPTVVQIMDFYGISERFPRDRFMVKNKEGLAKNKIYYTSELAKTVLTANKSRGFRFIHCGVFMFASHKSKEADAMHWRIQNEGIRIIEPWASKRLVTCTSKNTLYTLLTEMFPKLPKEGEHNLGEVGDQLMALEQGCCILLIDKSDEFPYRMVLPVWRHPASANLMVSKEDRLALLLRLYNQKDVHIKNHILEKELEEKESDKDLPITSKSDEDAEAPVAMDVDVEKGTAEEVEVAVDEADMDNTHR